MAKKHDGVDKGTTRTTPGNNEGARPPKKEDFEKIHEENQKEKKGKWWRPENIQVQRIVWSILLVKSLPNQLQICKVRGVIDTENNTGLHPIPNNEFLPRMGITLADLDRSFRVIPSNSLCGCLFFSVCLWAPFLK